MVENINHDPRVYMAAERTFLAWIRTSLALMAFGFVIARFGLFLRELEATNAGAAAVPTAFSLPIGVAFVLIGVNGDEDVAKAKEGGAQQGVNWRSFRDGGIKGPIAEQWNVTGWP